MLTMGLMMLGMFLFWGVLIFAAVLLVKALFQSGTSQKQSSEADLMPIDILNLRYSRGEITREQYDLMKSDISK